MNDTSRSSAAALRSERGACHKPTLKRAIFLRRSIQGLCLFIFLAGIFSVGSILPPDFFLHFDPLVAVITPIVSHSWLAELIPGFIILALTLALGGVFCGYLCPMGTTLDAVGGSLRFFVRLFGKKKSAQEEYQEVAEAHKIITRGWLQLKYLAFIVILMVAFLGFNMAFWGAPLALITRFYILLLEPLLPLAAAENAQRVYAGMVFLIVIFGLIFMFELIKPRFWCRYLCPAGGIIGFLSWFTPWRRRVKKCISCGDCTRACPVEAISSNGLSTARSECIVCRNCVDVCPVRGVVFSSNKEGDLKDESLVATEQLLGAAQPDSPISVEAVLLSERREQALMAERESGIIEAYTGPEAQLADANEAEDKADADAAAARRPRRRFVQDAEEPEAQSVEKTSKKEKFVFISRRPKSGKNLFGMAAPASPTAEQREEEMLREIKDIGDLPQVERPFSLTAPSRRAFIGATAVGALLGFVHFASAQRILSRNTGPNARPAALLRPPGALPELEFLSRCTRCGLCMKACPTNSLQPAWSNGWIEDIFSPVFTPRRGQCKSDCNICGQVCPTQAITPLPLAQKCWAKIGTADVIESRCLALDKNQACSICYEVCPYNAIEMVSVPNVKVPAPRVRAKNCYGCGCCEKNCPTARPAIVIKPTGSLRLSLGANYQHEARTRGLNIFMSEYVKTPPKNS